MAWGRLFLGALAAGWLLAGPASAAGPACGPHPVLARALAADHGEHPVGRGVHPGFVTELWVSPGGSFTVLAVRADGVACIVAAGEAWEFAHPTAREERS